MSSIYKTAAGKDQILALYRQNWDLLGLTLEHQAIPTRYGDTHVVVSGPVNAPPMVIFHGGNMISPVSFAWLASLAASYRLYAPDTVGHPGLSAETRLSPKTNQYGEWASDVISGLGLRQPIVQGSSYGAGIVLNLAACAPEQIGKAILVVPSGLVPMPLVSLATRILVPMLLYRITRRRAWLVRSIQPMIDPPPDHVVEITGKVFESVRIEPEMPRLIQPGDLACLKAPVLVLAAEKDVFFPARQVVARAPQVIPSLVAAETIAGSTHFIPPERWPWLCDRLRRFVEQGE
ncbi:MAG TPA: alpha/beta hydrolase [Anaerolineaceae bacterium]|nr:alpha/beta hydrolase [Anaerolineaceae bacterium]HPN50105.1 alpha/beta hydrolase [Anaerolineaceae bacterium]